MKFPLSRRQSFRLRHFGLRLLELIDILDTLPDRRAPLAPEIAGAALRTLREARAYAQLPPLGPVKSPVMPGEIAAETLSVLLALKSINALSCKAFHAMANESYARPLATGLD